MDDLAGYGTVGLLPLRQRMLVYLEKGCGKKVKKLLPNV
jgi:hypothetical protein